MSKALVEKEELNAVELFTKGGLDGLLKMIEKEVSSEVPDLSTDKGRKAVASNAYKVSRSKTAIDEVGKSLVSDWKRKAAEVDEKRRQAREFCDNLRDTIRKPLNEWEAEQERIKQEKERAEAERIRVIEEKIEKITSLETASYQMGRKEVEDAIQWLAALEITSDEYHEFDYKAEAAQEASGWALNERLVLIQEEEEQAAQLKEERKAIEASRKELEEAQQKLDEERDALRKEQEAKQQAEEEARRKEAAARAEQERKEREEAEKAEDERLAKLAEEQAAEERKQRQEHHDAIVETLVSAIADAAGINRKKAGALVEKINAGEIPHLTINF